MENLFGWGIVWLGLATTTLWGAEPCIDEHRHLIAENPQQFTLADFDRAKEFSAEAHRGEIWLHGHLYAEHYRQNAEVLTECGFPLDGSERSIRLHIENYLHDVVEKTPTTLSQIRSKFGDEVALTVDGTTPIDPEDPSDADLVYRAKQAYYEKTLRSPNAVLVKLADRIGNFCSYVRDGIIPERYMGGEHLSFRKALYRPGEAQPLWNVLEYLVKNAATLAAQKRCPPFKSIR